MEFTQSIERVVRESGLSKAEIAYLYVVTVPTIYNWLKGSKPTQAFIVHHSEAMSEILLRMIDKNILPMSITVTRPKRKQHLETILRQVLKTNNNAVQ